MRRYSFQDTVLVINGVMITGWAQGDDVISIERRSNSISDQVGVDGKMMISVSSDRSGIIRFRLQQTSSSNAFLLSLINQHEANTSSFTPITINFEDVYRKDRVSGTSGYLQKHASLVRGAKANDVEWTIVVEELDTILGDIGEN